MTKENNLVVRFSETDKVRVEAHLEKLLPHLSPHEFALVGGIAIRYHLAQTGFEYPIRPFNDLDMIAKRTSVVLPSVIDDFLIYHYHPQVENSFYIVLVDPQSRTKIDIFPYNPAPEKLITVNFKGYRVNLVSIEDQLVKSALDIKGISEEAKVDPKQFFDTQALMKIADLDRAEEIWQDKFYPKFQISLLETILEAQQIASQHPNWLKEKPFRKPSSYVCRDCQSNSDFPLTPMEDIYKILGYIE